MDQHESKLFKTKQPKVVTYKNKYFPTENESTETLLKDILEQEKKRINLKDSILNTDYEEEIADSKRKRLIELEKKKIFYNNMGPELPCNGISSSDKKTKKVQFLALQNYKLKKMFSKLENERVLNEKQKKLHNCLSSMLSKQKKVWLNPSYLIKAINECMLTRNWNNLTHLLLEFIHLSDSRYKPITKNIYQIMDRLHPVIYENSLQGKYKDIKSYHQKILNNTTIV